MDALIKHLAFTFADKQATDTILEQCAAHVLEGVIWRDTQRLKTAQHVVWETKYLHTRGLLCHHPVLHNLVRRKGNDEKTV